MDDKDKEQNMDEALKDAGKNFTIFITSLGMQALICMGQMPNPADQKTSTDLRQAKFTIDTLDTIREKTKGNLTPEETKMFDDILYGLRMKYLELDKGAGK